MLNEFQKNFHLSWRAGFGFSNGDPHISNLSNKKYLKQLFDDASKNFVALNVTANRLDELVKGTDNFKKIRDMSADERKQLQKMSREEIRNLNLEWLDIMTNSEQQLREKMALFWHNHFACRNMNVYFQQTLVNILREHALGNFGEMLMQVSKSAAMLQFLNNQQNRKEHPNENFAREVMELFTLGRGNYNEQDIKEAARAFTGWSFNLQGEFIFRPRLHDDGLKTFLGKTGNYTGEDIIKILLEQKQTARFITKKVYKFLVNENNIEESKIEYLANRFYQSNYSIKSLLEDIFKSDWFYDKKNVGIKIKSPVELLIGLRRVLPLKFENREIQLLFQRVLGQVLFYPPNVAGWKGGKTWIDSTTLMFRMRLPQIITNADEFTVKPKDMDDEMANYVERAKQVEKIKKVIAQKVQANISWNEVVHTYQNIKREELYLTIANDLLNIHSPSLNKETIEKYIDSSNRENYIKGVIVQLMCTPEYQLC